MMSRIVSCCVLRSGRAENRRKVFDSCTPEELEVLPKDLEIRCLSACSMRTQCDNSNARISAVPIIG